jgi:predicted LPLAT superfamily acyltransferase
VSLDWRQQPERGSLTGLRVMVWIAESFGRSAARALLYPICAYFVIGSGAARRAIARFRERVLGRPATLGEVFRHYYAFAATILDRLYFLRARFDLLDIQFHGLEVLDQELAKGRGCILLGAHLGSFEAVRAVGVLRRRLDIRVLMDERNAPMIRGLTQAVNPAVADTVIQAGGLEAMLRAKECLERGGIVGVMGDRVMKQEQAATCVFFGLDARFPTGGMRLAHVIGAPVVLFVGLYRGGNRYEVHLESFSGEAGSGGDRREADVNRDVQRYVEWLERVCRLAPDNWFNFYDFWDEGR